MSELKEYKCPNCDGVLEFNSNTQSLSCPHCGGSFDVETFGEDRNYTIKADIWNNDDLLVFTCNACGGQIIVDQDTAATSCPYCGSSVVNEGNIVGNYKPSRLIPFKYDKKAAKEAYLKHLMGKPLIPDSFKTENTINELKGVYVPFWIFDGHANAQVWYNATKTRTWSDQNYNYTETQHYKLFRAGHVDFDDVPVDASSKMDDSLMQSIEAFSSKDLVDFNENYLAGYYATKYDLPAESLKSTADERIMNSTTSLLSSTTTGFQTCTPTSKRMRLTDGWQEYVMYPVYILNTTYEDKKYTFAMNGQTGKFVGDLPIDKGKLIKYSLLGFFIPFILISLFQFYLLNFNFRYFEPKYLVISSIVSLLIMFIVRGILKGKMRSVSKKYSAHDYIVPGSFVVTGHSDYFVNSTVSKTPRSNNNGSSRTGSNFNSMQRTSIPLNKGRMPNRSPRTFNSRSFNNRSFSNRSGRKF